MGQQQRQGGSGSGQMKQKWIMVALALLLLAATLFFFRLQITTVILIRALNHAVAGDIEIELADLSSRNMHLSRLACSLPGSGGSIILQNAVLDWDRSLLRDKRLNSIKIDSLVVELPLKTNTTSDKKFSIQQTVENISSQLQSLPFKKLHIARLVIKGQAAGSLAGRGLTLDLQNNSGMVSARLLLHKEKLQLTFDAVSRNRWSMTLADPTQDMPIVSAGIHLEDAQLKAEITAELSRLNMLNPLLKTPLPKLAGRLAATVTVSLNKKNTADIGLHLQQPTIASWQADSIDLVLHGKLDHSGQVLLGEHSKIQIATLQKGPLTIWRLGLDLDGHFTKKKNWLQYTFADNSLINAQKISNGNLRIGSLQLPASMSGTLSDNKITLTLPAGHKFLATGIYIKTISMAQASLMPIKDTNISLRMAKKSEWTMAPSHWQYILKPADLGSITIEPATMDINLKSFSGKAKEWRVDADITCPYLHLKNNNNGLSVKNIAATFKGDMNQIKGTGSWSSQGIPGAMVLDFSHNLNTGEGRAVINTTDPFTPSKDTPLSTILDKWPLPADLTDGLLQIDSSIHWHPLEMNLQVAITEGEGNYKTTHFSGLATRQNIKILPSIRSGKTGILTIDEVDAGIPMQSFSTRIRLQPSSRGPLPEIILKDTRISLFGGTISDDLLSVDPQKPEIQSRVTLNNIQLPELISLQQVKGLTVTGKLHGTLPFRVDKSGLHIDNGRLQNMMPGGIIRYNPPGNIGMKESPFTKYALKALEEFHFDLLSATATYNPDGELRMELHLEGKSPKLGTTRPVHLNINTEQNLLSLLKSLRYSTSLTNEIDREVQQHFHNKPSP